MKGGENHEKQNTLGISSNHSGMGSVITSNNLKEISTMTCCLRIGSSEDVKPEPVKKRFDFMFQANGKVIGFNAIGAPYYITDHITKQFKGMSYTYLCTKDGSVYSTNNLQIFKKGGE